MSNHGDNLLMERLASHGLSLSLEELRECLRLADKVFRADSFKPSEVVWCLDVLTRLEPVTTPASPGGGGK